MSISLIAHTANPASPGGSGGASNPIDTTGANFLVLLTTTFNGPTVSDSYSNAWIALSDYNPGGGTAGIRCYYVENPVVGTGHTFDVSGSSVFPGFVVGAFSGMAISSVFDTGTDSGNYAASASSNQPGSVTPSSGEKLVITGLGTFGPVTNLVAPSDSTTYALIDSANYSGGSNFGIEAAYGIQTPNGAATNPTWDTTPGVSTSCNIAAFKAGAGGGTVYTKAVNDSITQSDLIIKQNQRHINETITCNEVISKQGQKSFLSTFTVSETFSTIKVLIRSFTETFTIGSSLVFSTTKQCIENIVLVEVFKKSAAKVLSESFSISESFSKIKVTIKSFIDSFTISETLAKKLNRSINDVITLLDTFSRGSLYFRSFVESFSITESFSAVIHTIVSIIPYMRRYLDDPTSVGSIGPSVDIDSGSPNNDTDYFRRYLNDVD